ncbi:glutathione S-transferase [Aspergillus pseudocaelatus]|uniref:Glutathione S-transferase n=1 Tax=Aspergillus pseudocaelatus TaxID=1825620 RepID=A0ABQ6WUK2_9EURO|nr:glutathione S-transferase [Aspergillus pseudocaelatus]
MSLKPLILHGHSAGPNPWKVAMLLNELNIPYDYKYLQFAEIKSEPFFKINPNGRVPAIEDPNTGITLWESGAILEYLVETYDKEKKFSFEPGTPEYFHAKQWLHFQMSGQGPYFGQAVWFTKYHPEKVESARLRYINEIRRVSETMNNVLADREYLVGDKYSYADLSFVPWFGIIPWITGDAFELEKDFPHLNAWLERIKARPAIAKALAEKAEATSKMTQP